MKALTIRPHSVKVHGKASFLIKQTPIVSITPHRGSKGGCMRTISRSMRSWSFYTLLVALAIVLPFQNTWSAGVTTLSGLEETTASLNDPRTTSLRQWLKGVVEKAEVPGASLLIAQSGRVVFREAYGLGDVQANKPLTEKTVVLIASAIKPISATGIMSLVEEGRISLDDKVSKYLPAFDRLKPAKPGGRTESPTLRQLLCHTSGLYGLVGASKTGMRAVRDFSLSLSESVDLIAQEELAADPGVKFNYGGANFQVAARIAELVSQKPFDQYLNERLFSPLKMGQSFFKPGSSQDVGDFAMPYNYDKDKGLVPIPIYAPDPNRRLILASGGLYSTLNDLSVFLQMHLNGGSYGPKKILSQASVEQMQNRQTGAAQAPYGLGWFIGRAEAGGRSVSVNHSGLFGALVWIDMDRDLIGVFLTSSLWPGRQQLYQELQKKILELFPAGS